MDPRSAQVPVAVRLPATGADALQVELVPALGAKVTSLRLGAGREWLAPAVRALASPARPDQAWAELDCSGWDECFPNIGASRALGLLDHGEVWRHPWLARPLADGVATQIGTDRYRLRRSLRVSGNRLVADYRLHNVGSAPLDWAWAQHPLLALTERTCLVLPAPARIRLDSAFDHGSAAPGVEWLCPAGTLAAETPLVAARGHAAKVWFERPRPSAVGVREGDEWLTWRSVGVPDLGLWVNLGGWGERPLAHLAVEPGVGSCDDPEVAYACGASAGTAALLPGTRRDWQVVIEAGRGEESLAAALAEESLPNYL